MKPSIGLRRTIECTIIHHPLFSLTIMIDLLLRLMLAIRRQTLPSKDTNRYMPLDLRTIQFRMLNFNPLLQIPGINSMPIQIQPTTYTTTTISHPRTHTLTTSLLTTINILPTLFLRITVFTAAYNTNTSSIDPLLNLGNRIPIKITTTVLPLHTIHTTITCPSLLIIPVIQLLLHLHQQRGRLIQEEQQHNTLPNITPPPTATQTASPMEVNQNKEIF